MKKVILTIIILLGTFIRIILLLQNRSFWWDETANFEVSQYSVSAILSGDYYLFPNHPWFYYLILKAVSLISLKEIYLRLPSVISGIMLIYIIFLLTKAIIGNTKIALLAGFLYSISAYQVFHSIHAKENEIIVLFNLISLLYYFYFVKHNGKIFLFIHLFFLYLSLVTSYFTFWYLFILLFINLYYFREKIFREKIKRLMSGYFIVCLFFFPWLYLLLQKYGSAVSLLLFLQKPHFSELINSLNMYFGYKPLVYYNIPLIFIAILAFILLKKYPQFVKNLLLFWLFYPLIAAYIISLVYRPMFIDHHMILSSIALYIILATVIHKYKRWGIIIIFFFLFSNIKNNRQELISPTVEDWRSVTKEIFLHQNINSRDYIIVDDRQAFNYYVNFHLKPEIKPDIFYLTWEDEAKKDTIINLTKKYVEEGRKVCLAATFISFNDIKLTSLNITGNTDLYPQVLCLEK